MIQVAHARGYDCALKTITGDFSHAFHIKTFDECKVDFIAAIGGDGTMLWAAAPALQYGVPVLGINAGRVGFLSEITIDAFDDALSRMEKGEYTVDKRRMLDCSVDGEKARQCLNDLILYKCSFSKVAEIAIRIAGVDAGQIYCDGIIVSTPTGSTGYSISAGGPIVAPGADVLLVTPICPHALTMRPIVVSVEQKIELIVKNDACVALDGVLLADLSPNARVSICASSDRIGFIRLHERNLYALIRRKLS